MSEQQQAAPPPPPPPPPTTPVAPQKKGFGVLGWLAIGCVGLIVIGGLLAFACTAVVANKAKNFVDEASVNPAMSAAEMVVKVNPNLELVEKDEEAQTLTIYDKQKDKRLTLDLEDVMAGKFGVETEDGETMNFEVGQTEDGSFGATMTDAAGDVSEVTIGAEGVRVGQGAEDLPGWLPTYKGAELSSPFNMATSEGVRGTAMFSTPDTVSEVADAMTADLEGRGFEVETTKYEAAGVKSVILSCTGQAGEDLKISINSRGDATAVAMNYSGKS